MDRSAPSFLTTCQHWISQAFKAASNFGVPVGVSIASLCEPSETNRYKVNSANWPTADRSYSVHAQSGIHCSVLLLHYSIIPLFHCSVFSVPCNSLPVPKQTLIPKLSIFRTSSMPNPTLWNESKQLKKAEQEVAWE